MSLAGGPASIAKRLRFLAMNMAVAGLIVGIGLPVLFHLSALEVAPTSGGFDLVWLAPLAVMVFDFVLAGVLWRRAAKLERGPLEGGR
jgi:uncharacterized membrane protein (DUF485 family)